MIVKIKSHKRPIFEKILSYMVESKDRLFDREEKSFIVAHNLKGNSIAEWTKHYSLNEEFRLRKRKDSIYLTHEILSWHKDDGKHLTLAKMEDMAREYIKLRNPRGIYLAVPHFDREHYHIHILASGIEYKTGNSLRLSKSDLQKLKKDIQQYQVEKFPEISKSIVEHGKRVKPLISEKEYQVKLRTGRETQREQVFAILNTCYKMANSKESFYTLINECGLKTYERGGKTSGVVYKNYKFRFTRLGFSPERLEELNKVLVRGKELGIARRNSKSKTIIRNR